MRWFVLLDSVAGAILNGSCSSFVVWWSIELGLWHDDWPTLYRWCRWPMDAKKWRVLWDGLSCLTLLLVQFAMGHVLRSWCGDRSNLACDTMTDRLCIDGVGDRWMRKIGGCYEMVCLAWLCCWCNFQWVMFFVRGVVIDRTWPVTRWLTDFVLMV